VAWSISNTVEDALNNRIGTLKISSQPSGADVYIDGKNEGKTPSQISVVRGKHNLTVKMDGFIPFKGEIEIQSKTVTEQNVVLREVPYKLFEKAMIYEKKRDWEGAIVAYDEFIKTYGDTKEADNAYYRKGHIEMMFLKKYGDALKTFDALVKRYPDAMTRAEGYYGLMRAYELLGNREKAVEIKNYLLSYYGETNAAEEARKTNY
jgi:TolA-binding protein